ncbi:putative ABC exporter domain-containing protein [Hydrogenoanaerobacterium sp.]|uniref:putative ABC exporter domain-containing protein n=1 Tax=Hydrogenoanaerobacterium sp. TaxID=2953763 RepID=UPI00289A314B|nr:putative ABC exporter domain-containing protein [Hydrogenoanaerobacterium sp.]
MKSLFYLLRTTLKNNLKELIRRPAKLILTLFVVLMLGFMVVSAMFTIPMPGKSYRSIAELTVMMLGLYAFMFAMGVLQGLGSGASFFSMADVHMLFPAPIPSHRVLLYGLVKQMSTSLYVGFFLLFQYSWLHQSYGISFGALLIILLGYCLCVFCSQLTAMAIYTFTSQNERVRTAVRIGFYTILGVFSLYILLPAFTNKGDVLGSIVSAANTPIAALFPVAGWLKAAVAGFLSANWAAAVLGLLATVLFAAALIVAIAKARGDFYEDVLKATEVSLSAITAKKQGKFADSLPQNVKVGKIGIGKGQGASVFFYKHMLENRRSRFLMLDKTSLLFIAMTIGFSYFMRDEGLIPVLFFSVYLQIFSVATGRWVNELLLPYVYLTPEPPFLKLLHLCRESICKVVLEAVVLFIPVGLLLSLSPLEIAACIAMRIGFGVLFIAGNILIERVLGSLTSKVIIMMLYFLIMILICVPGLIIGFAVMAALGDSGPTLPLLTTFVWNTLCASLILFLCRDILNYAELNNR